MAKISIPATKFGESEVEDPGMVGITDAEDDRTNRARREMFVRMLTNHTRLNREEAAEYVEANLPDLIRKFGSPRDPEDMEEDMDKLKDSLLGKGFSATEKKKKSMEDELNEY